MTSRVKRALPARRSRGKAETRGQRNVAWIERYCRIPEGRDVGKAVKLRPWQKREVCKIYDNPARTRRAGKMPPLSP